MVPFDYLAWAKRAKAFIRELSHLPGKLLLDDSIETPATAEYDQEWLTSKECSLPIEIRDWLSTATRRCTFHYEWELPSPWGTQLDDFLPGVTKLCGGADLCDASGYSLEDGRRTDPESPAFWFGYEPDTRRGNLLMLTRLENGEQLALELNAENNEQGVLCVFEDSTRAPHRLSFSFPEFLSNWETCCYWKPTLESLQPWLNTDGLLRPEAAKAQQLRQLFFEAGHSNG